MTYGINMDGCGWSWATPIAMVKTYVVGEYQQRL